MNIRQEIALALQCQITVPDFKVSGMIEDSQAIELLQTPGWELREDVIINASDNNVTQIYYFNGQSLQHPLIAIDDPYLFASKQGGKIDCNLVTMFPGELKISKYLPELTNYLISIDYKGYVSLTFSIFNNKLFYNSIKLELAEDYIQNILNLYNLSLDWYIADIENDTLPEPTGISASTRLYGYPYYTDNNLALIDNIPVPGAYELTDSYAISYYQEKFHIKDVWHNLYKQLNDPVYAHNGICYNTDGGYKARKVYDLLKKNRLIQ